MPSMVVVVAGAVAAACPTGTDSTSARRAATDRPHHPHRQQRGWAGRPWAVEPGPDDRTTPLVGAVVAVVWVPHHCCWPW